MYLLDAMECPDYAFKAIMEWARKCFEAGFDFNPKCKTRLDTRGKMVICILGSFSGVCHHQPRIHGVPRRSPPSLRHLPLTLVCR
jgi:hypothetical protein